MTEELPPVRTLVWRRHDVPGLEHCRLRTDAAGPTLAGTVVAVLSGIPLRVEYAIHCSPAWETRNVHVTTSYGPETRRLELAADDRRRWWLDGRELPSLTGCVDVDLGVTPSTNTLPIRRLRLATGEGSDVTAAWVRFPELTVEPLPQRYERRGQRLYRYESSGGAFTADLTVDEWGLVERYPPLWDLIAPAPGAVAAELPAAGPEGSR